MNLRCGQNVSILIFYSAWEWSNGISVLSTMYQQGEPVTTNELLTIQFDTVLQQTGLVSHDTTMENQDYYFLCAGSPVASSPTIQYVLILLTHS